MVRLACLTFLARVGCRFAEALRYIFEVYMSASRVDLSVLRPFTSAQIDNYLAFLRKNGAASIAAAVEAALEAGNSFAERRDNLLTAVTPR